MYSWIRLIAASVLIFPLAVQAQEPRDESTKPDYDAALAEELGADAYGMRRYVLASLETGSAPSPGRDEQARIQAGHMAHIRALADSGQLVLAGPYLDGDSPRGLFVLAVEDVAEARSLVEADPAVQAGLLSVSLRPWYGSAALMRLNDIHERISREQP